MPILKRNCLFLDNICPCSRYHLRSRCWVCEKRNVSFKMLLPFLYVFIYLFFPCFQILSHNLSRELSRNPNKRDSWLRQAGHKITKTLWCESTHTPVWYLPPTPWITQTEAKGEASNHTGIKQESQSCRVGNSQNEFPLWLT